MEKSYDVEKLYDKIMELKEGNNKDRDIAFKCIGILSNESTNESYESRIEIVSKLIENYYNKK